MNEVGIGKGRIEGKKGPEYRVTGGQVGWHRLRRVKRGRGGASGQGWMVRRDLAG